MARKSYRKHRKGGSAPDASSYSSAASYGVAVNGPLDSQIKNSLMSDGLNGQSQSITSVGLQGQNVGIPPNQLMKGGRRHKTKSKRGGFWGQVINQAIVPFSILGMQQTYRRKKRGGKMTRRNSQRRR